MQFQGVSVAADCPKSTLWYPVALKEVQIPGAAF
jgi:hypothetical protein